MKRTVRRAAFTVVLIIISVAIGTTAFTLFIFYGFEIVRPVSYHDAHFQMTACAIALLCEILLFNLPIIFILNRILKTREKPVVLYLLTSWTLIVLYDFAQSISGGRHFPALNLLYPRAITDGVPELLCSAIFMVGYVSALLSGRNNIDTERNYIR